MKALCKPFRCLSFLGGRKPPDQYSVTEGQHLAKTVEEDDDEDDFFGDSWGEGGASGSSASQTKEAEAQRGGVDRNPTRDTTTKRPVAPTGGNNSQGNAQTPGKPGKKQDCGGEGAMADFFNELGMEPEYRAPRVLDKDKGPSVSSLLDEGEVSTAAWGNDDLDI
eukprot:g29828.t1